MEVEARDRITRSAPTYWTVSYSFPLQKSQNGVFMVALLTLESLFALYFLCFLKKVTLTFFLIKRYYFRTQMQLSV